MAMNPRGRSRGRSHNNYNNNNNNNNNRRNNHAVNKNTVYDSIGPTGRVRGTAYQLMEKYLSVAKEQMTSDRVLAENCLQHAEHYMRINAMFVAQEAKQNQAQQQVSAEENAEEQTQKNTAEVAEQAVEEVAEQEEVAEKEEVVEEKASEISEETLKKIAEVDLSVPVSTMVANEVKARRGRPPVKKEDRPIVIKGMPPKRRGRPALKKIEQEA